MSRQKVWYTKIVKIPGESLGGTGKMANRIAWAIKQVLTQAPGFAPEGIPYTAAWSTYSSSNGNLDLGSALNGDRWLNPSGSNPWSLADNLPRAANGTAHSWCILKAPPQFVLDSGFGVSSKYEFYMNIGLNSLSPINSFTFSYDVPATPTAAYRSPMSQNTTLPAYWGWDAANAGLNNRDGSNLSYMAPIGLDSSNTNALTQETHYLNVTVADDGSFYASLRSGAYWHPYYLWLLMCVKIPYENLLSNPLAGSTVGVSSTHNIYTFMSSWGNRGTGKLPAQLENGFSSYPGNGNSWDSSSKGGFSSFNSISSPSHKSKKLSYYNASRLGNTAVLATTATMIGFNSVDGDNAYYRTEQLESSNNLMMAHPFMLINAAYTEGNVTGASNITQTTLSAAQVSAIVPDFYIASGSIKSHQIIESAGDNYITIGQLIAPISSGNIPL